MTPIRPDDGLHQHRRQHRLVADHVLHVVHARDAAPRIGMLDRHL